jgi:hypothetical protein
MDADQRSIQMKLKIGIYDILFYLLAVVCVALIATMLFYAMSH